MMNARFSIAPRRSPLLKLARSAVAIALVTFGVLLGQAGEKARAAGATVGEKTGIETGLPIPRFVSLKKGATNLRVGPGRKFQISWRYQRKAVPVEVIQEFDLWRRVRDAEGATGWVLHSLLSNKRSAIVAPWEMEGAAPAQPIKASYFDAKRKPSTGATTIARLQPGLQVSLRECEDAWCRVAAQGHDMWVRRETLWGVYKDETVED